ncbi:MAG: hypothetical protein J6578_07450 [Snodgrassella sp.]|uniref:hypothetical protein n=1 Tax=Snodgrassella TaxID=1193515 RepID=UPI001EF6D768|nr:MULTISPECIES: hypothetical protein [Snodgrassella]MCO6508611.1 hypothetical protein [Snodgrassella sp.]
MLTALLWFSVAVFAIKTVAVLGGLRQYSDAEMMFVRYGVIRVGVLIVGFFSQC